MGGIVGRFMKSFGLTMAFAIMVSLLVSFTLTPMLSARWLKVDKHGKDKHSSKDSKVFHAVDAFYTRLLEWSMAHRAIVAGMAVLVLLSSVPLFMVANKNFLPQDDQSEFEINIRAPEGTSLESTEVDHEPRGHGRAPAAAGGGLHPGDGRRRSGQDAQPGEHLRAAEADREPRARSVRPDGHRAQRHPAAADEGHADLGPADRDDRRRRRAERGHPVPDQRPGPAEARHDLARAGRSRAQDTRRRGSGYVDERRQARAVGAASTGPRRRTSACRSRTPPRRCACWSAAIR